jgi:hypothetical protein
MVEKTFLFLLYSYRQTRINSQAKEIHLNLSSIIDHGALYFKDKIALVYGENKSTYGHLKSAMERIAPKSKK